MTPATKHLMDMLEAAYDPDFIDTMDDMINADNVAQQILRTTYKNADYDFLRAYAKELMEYVYRLNFS